MIKSNNPENAHTNIWVHLHMLMNDAIHVYVPPRTGALAFTAEMLPLSLLP